jgi:hypothetical protein
VKVALQKSFLVTFVQLWIPVITIIFSAGVGYGFLNEQIALLNERTQVIMQQNKESALTITTLQNQQNTIEIQVAKIQQILVDEQTQKNNSQNTASADIPFKSEYKLLNIENIAGSSARLKLDI